ncbi:MAG: Hpt domain-containing protein [Alteromonadaceae bacterium]|nr:Hpt domain-containing protein [Alteromonadaceae bacterium]
MSVRTDLYLSLMKGFNKDQQGLVEKLEQLYTSDSGDMLYLTVHSLKSNAGYLGAYDLSEACGEFEAVLGKGKTDLKLLNKVTRLLKPLLFGLKLIYAETPVADKEVFSSLRLKQDLTQLLPLLQTSDFAVEEPLSVLQDMCISSDYASVINDITQYVDDIEYEKATVAATQLLKELETGAYDE